MVVKVVKKSYNYLGGIMQRYFCRELNNNNFTLSNDDSYHIMKVMRMNLGDLIEIVYNKETYLSKIISFNPVVCEIEEKLDENNELDKKIYICQSLVNEQKMDYILQKGTELGAFSFIPFLATNSVIKDNGKSDKKINRWQKIVKEASEQSKRNVIPEVLEFHNINDLINFECDLKIVCSVNEKVNNMKNIIQKYPKCDTIMVVIGPEGGFTEKEEEIFKNNGFILVSLGNRVLRTETASLMVLSMFNYEWMV